MLKRLIITAIIFTAFLVPVFGQQDALINFESFGDMYNNPANIMNEDVWKATISYNNSLQGFEDGPETAYLSFGGPGINRDMMPSLRYNKGIKRHKNYSKYGFGGYVLRDSYGYYNYNSFILNYAQKFKLSRSEFLSFGIGIGIYNSQIDADKLRVSIQEDPAYTSQLEYDGRFTMGDVNFGASYASNYVQAGIAVRHLLDNKLKLGATPGYAKLSKTFVFTAKGKVDIGQGFMLVPGFQGNYAVGVPLDIKISVPAVFEDMFMAGLAYTPTKSVSIEAGAYFNNIIFGYSFAVNTSRISDISNVGHQIGIRYILPIWSREYRNYSLTKDLF